MTSSYTLRGTVARPPETVFAAIADPAAAPARFSGAAAGVLVSAPPMRAGSVVRTTRTVAGRTVTADATIEVHRPSKELEIRGGVQGIEVVTRWRLTPDGAGTKVEFECRVTGSGLAAFVEGPVADALRTADADHIERLARHVG